MAAAPEISTEKKFKVAEGWGLVRGQFGAQNHQDWMRFTASVGYKGYEAATWEFGDRLLKCAGNPATAAVLAQEMVAEAKAAGLCINALAVHLQGQVLGDEPSAKTLNFIGGAALEAYKVWRKAGNIPARNDPFYVPPEVGVLMHDEAQKQLLGAVELAAAIREIQGTHVTLPGFVGAPAGRWASLFEFPPVPKNLGGYAIDDCRKVSGELLLERFAPVWDRCKALGIKFGLECHPTEFAMGDLASAAEFLELVRKGGYGDVVGFNFDGSHMRWQGINEIEFIREFAQHIFAAHLKGTFISPHPTRNGLLGGYQPMGSAGNGWNFTTPGGPRDSMNQGMIISSLRERGYKGPINVEWEDQEVDPREGARFAFNILNPLDLLRPPEGTRHDDALKASPTA